MTESILENARYMVENPSAWEDGFDQGASDSLAAALSAYDNLRVQVNRLRRERDEALDKCAAIGQSAIPFISALTSCEGGRLPPWLTTAQLRVLVQAITGSPATALTTLRQRHDAACAVLSDYYSEVEKAEHDCPDRPCVINPGTRHRADAVLADNPKWGLEIYGLYQRLEQRAEAAEARVKELERRCDGR